MLEVLVLDLGACPHHEGADEDDAVFPSGVVLLGAEDLEQLVTDAAVEGVATLVDDGWELRRQVLFL